MAAYLILGLLSVASAAPPVSGNYPEVIPGPGLPSLESLGITSAELYQLPHPSSPAFHSLAANFDARCGPFEDRYTNVNGIIACYHYLDRLGTQQCTIPSEHSRFCESGSAAILGQADDFHGASSYCRDVASAVLWTINHCTRPDQSCAGAQAANGNGNLIVLAGSSSIY